MKGFSVMLDFRCCNPDLRYGQIFCFMNFCGPNQVSKGIRMIGIFTWGRTISPHRFHSIFRLTNRQLLGLTSVSCASFIITLYWQTMDLLLPTKLIWNVGYLRAFYMPLVWTYIEINYCEIIRGFFNILLF